MSESNLQRQSDLERLLPRDGFSPELPKVLQPRTRRSAGLGLRVLLYMLRGMRVGSFDVGLPNGEIRHFQRSEEHTSELQSLMRISYAVFCLKKTKKHNENKTSQ